MKKFLAIMLAVLLLLCVTACKKDDTASTNPNETEELEEGEVMEYNEFQYAVNEFGDYEIVGYTYGGLELRTVDVPAQIDGRPVTGIGFEAFKSFKTIQAVNIPASVTYIADYAFYACDALTAITLPDSITTIGKGAFEKCPNLAAVKLSAKLTEIDDFAFLDCPKLTGVTLPEGLLTIGNGAFKNCDALTAITIPTSVTKIGSGAFADCGLLTTVVALGDVNQLGDGIFANAASDMKLTVKAGSALEAYAKKWYYPIAEAPTPAA